ncbi:MAG: hypothetical protein ACYDAG_18030 [Chloroflexota bacterium]
MVTADSQPASPATMPEGKLPPVTQTAVIAMILVIAAGIDIAAYLPNRAPLAVPAALLAAAGLAVIANAVALSRLREFAWRTFFTVGKWALLAYIIIAGMLELVFVLDGTPGDVLVLMTIILALFAIDVPMLFAFSVARYQPPQPARR